MSDTGILEKRNSEFSQQESNLRPSDYSCSDALPLSYRSLVGANAIKLGSWDKHRSCILNLKVDVRHMRNGRNVMVYVKPGE